MPLNRCEASISSAVSSDKSTSPFLHPVRYRIFFLLRLAPTRHPASPRPQEANTGWSIWEGSRGNGLWATPFFFSSREATKTRHCLSF
ncbi:hypothetical protein CGRA01v4_03328 [Colletotrichum graminicola]|nr:hypothetical protein CGRA01v4_03328 [Colletotrichum graminicola]